MTLCLRIFFLALLLQWKFDMFDSCANDVCGNSTSFSIDKQVQCFCANCTEYGDCCEDMPRPKDSLISSDCNIKMNSSLHAYSVVKCASWWIPANTNDTLLKTQCEDVKSGEIAPSIFNYIPVYSSQTKTVYRNIYCAKCNIKRIEMSNLKLFAVRSHYTQELAGESNEKELTQMALEEYVRAQSDRKKNLDTENSFEIEFESPMEDASLRYCVKSIDSCPGNSSDRNKEWCRTKATAYRYLCCYF